MNKGSQFGAGFAAAHRIKVAFDLSALTAQPSGIGHYALNLAGALSARSEELELHLFAHRDLRLHPKLASLVRKQPYCFPVRAIWMQLLLPAILNKIQPDLCHFTNSLAPLAIGQPYVVSIHDMSLSLFPAYHKFPKRYYSRLLIPWVARKAAAVITDSRRSRSDIEKILGIPKARIHAIPLAAGPQFQPVSDAALLRQVQLRYGLNPPYFIFVGNLEPRKNLSRLLQAFACLAAESSRHTLCLVGQFGWQLGDLGPLIDRLGIRDRVRQIGYVPDEDLPPLYGGAEFFIYPSLLEGFGLPVLEAMSCGVPAMVSSGSGLDDVAGEAALYVDPLDTSSIFEGLRRMARDQELRMHLSQAGLARAGLFSWEETARKTTEVYRRVLDSGKPYGTSVQFRLRVELDAPASPGKPEPGPSGAPLDGREWAVLKTVVYTSLFNYPLTAQEIARRLFDLPLSPGEVNKTLDGSDLLKRLIERTGEYVHLPGHRGDIALRAQREATTREAIHRDRRVLRALCRMPWVRMVAFSGSTAHANMNPGDDLDLFMVVRPERLWLFFLAFTLLARIAGKRRMLCVNFVLSSSRLELDLNDFFSADQVLSLKPQCGEAFYDEILHRNPWIDNFFPGRRPVSPEGGDSRPLPASANRGGLPALLDRLVLRAYGAYLLRKSRQGMADLELSPHQIKVHLQSHRQDIGIRFQRRLNLVLSGSYRGEH